MYVLVTCSRKLMWHLWQSVTQNSPQSSIIICMFGCYWGIQGKHFYSFFESKLPYNGSYVSDRNPREILPPESAIEFEVRTAHLLDFEWMRKWDSHQITSCSWFSWEVENGACRQNWVWWCPVKTPASSTPTTRSCPPWREGKSKISKTVDSWAVVDQRPPPGCTHCISLLCMILYV